MKRLERLFAGETPGRIEHALPRLLPEVSAQALRRAIKARDVKLEGRRAGPGAMVYPGQHVQVYVDDASVEDVCVVFEDAQYLLVNKRQGIETQGAENSAEAMCARHAGVPVFACHRLDAQTGGLLLMAKSPEALARAQAAFAAHAVEKTYLCRVCGIPAPRQADLTAWLYKDAARARVRILDAPAPGALSIRTRYRVRAEEGDTALVEVALVTGRTHQIRAHLAHIGHPILGDDKYGDRALNRRYGVRRQQLWAVGLTLWDGRRYAVEAPFVQKPRKETDCPP